MQNVAIELNGGFLDMGISPKMSLYYRNAFFNFEVRVGNKSLPFDVPPTPHNKKLLGFYDRIDTESGGEFDSTLWLYGNRYRKGKLKVSYEGGNFKCTFFWGLASKAPQLKEFKLSQLDHVFDYSDYAPSNDTYFASARLYYNNSINSDNPARRFGDVFFSVFDNPVFTLRIKRSTDNTLYERNETLSNNDSTDVKQGMEEMFENFAAWIRNEIPDMSATLETQEGTGLLIFWQWDNEAPPVNMEILEITTTSKVDSKVFTAFFYSWSLELNKDRYPEVDFPLFFADSLPFKEEYLNSMTELRLNENRFMVLNHYYFVPFIRLDFILEQLAEAIGFTIQGIENVGTITVFTAQLLNFQFRFNIGEALPDITANDFFKVASVLYGLHLDFNEEFNILSISKKKGIIKTDATADYTKSIYYYQGYHDKIPPEGKGFEFKLGDFSFKQQEGAFKIEADVNTLIEKNSPLPAEIRETGETETRQVEVQDQQGNISFIEVQVPIVEVIPLILMYHADGLFLYNFTEGSGRIDDLIVVDMDPEDPQKALTTDPEKIYRDNYQELIELRTQRDQLILPAVFDASDVYSIDENSPFLMDNQKLMPTEFRLEIGDKNPVVGEVYCHRIL